MSVKTVTKNTQTGDTTIELVQNYLVSMTSRSILVS